MLSFCHGAEYPHLVDKRKPTIGGLRNSCGESHNNSMAQEFPFAKIGSRLIRLRETYFDGSQREWATKHGFSPTQYNNWEKGSRRIPVDQAERLCDAYGLTLDFVYRGRLEGLSENARKAV